MKRLLFGVLLVLTFVAAPLLRSQIKTKSLIITQTSTNIAMKGDTIRFAWSDSTQGAEYEVSVAYDGKGEFTPLATRLSKSSFNWKIPDSAGKNAVFQIVRSVEGARIDSVTSEKPLTIAEKDEKPLQGIDAVRSRDTSGSNRGFGINIGASFDLIDGLKNSSLFSELRFTEPLLIGHEKLGDKTMICPLFSGIVGGSLALRQSRTHYPSAISTLTVTHGEAITDGVTPTQSAQLKFDRSIEMNVTTLEFSVFLPFIRKTIDVDSSRFWSPSQKTEILLAVTCEVELFD
jgi:hypothetical protein